jgi:hypothetical protein
VLSVKNKCEEKKIKMRRKNCSKCLVIVAAVAPLLLLLLTTLRTVQAALPEASSTLLKMHRYYTDHPPHDYSLYHTLNVHPNATLHEITKSYRRLTRVLHPDKQAGDSLSSDDDREEGLQQVREAYEVLKDDSTRLPYHRFGLIDTDVAAFLLTGGTVGTPASFAGMSIEQQRLLQWMGYGPDFTMIKSHQDRVMFLAATLLERIRPLVEGTIDENVVADVIAQECDVLKRLPLGAQIIRCIGRAYRHAGQHVLRKHRAQSRFLLWRAGADLSGTVRAKMRSAKQVLTAAVASGRAMWTEKQLQQQRHDKELLSDVPAIGYHNEESDRGPFDEVSGFTRMNGTYQRARRSPFDASLKSQTSYVYLQLISDHDVDDLSSHLQSNEEIQQQERWKAQSAQLESLQVEALWKISKIDLDRTIQEACNLILSGDYFFFPFHQSPIRADPNRAVSDGWVASSTGETVSVDVGKLRAAAALVMMGDIMVQCSKEGTSWRE